MPKSVGSPPYPPQQTNYTAKYRYPDRWHTVKIAQIEWHEKRAHHYAMCPINTNESYLGGMSVRLPKPASGLFH